ncbi:MAG: GNAT family N-acetyltransferase [Chloroflexaceae bacterium]|nr:GNAT family N-acetyltransferase [Chloroflexaceae bacterium]
MAHRLAALSLSPLGRTYCALCCPRPIRGSGLADRLIAEGLAWATDHGFERVQLYVTASNQAAHACYRRCGFVPVQHILRRDLRPHPVSNPRLTPPVH